MVLTMSIFVIPTKASKAYLNPLGFVYKTFSVKEGDVIRGDYETYDSPFLVGVGYEYLGDIVVFSNFYTSGWFEIDISEGSVTLTVTLVNVDLRSGYIEYTIGKKDGSEFNFMPIIIGVVVIIVISTVIGLSIHAINKKKQREKEFDSLNELRTQIKKISDEIKERNTKE